MQIHIIYAEIIILYSFFILAIYLNLLILLTMWFKLLNINFENILFSDKIHLFQLLYNIRVIKEVISKFKSNKFKF